MVERIRHDAPVLVIGLGRFGAAMRRPARPARPRGARRRRDREPRAEVVRAGHARGAGRRAQHRRAPADRRAGLLDRRRARSARRSRHPCSSPRTSSTSRSRRSGRRRSRQSHGKILARIGANHVIYPEREAGERVAHLVSGRMLDFIEFDDDFAIVKMYPPKPIRGMGLNESGVRSKYNVTVVGVKSPGKPFTYATERDRGVQPRPHHRVGHQRRHREVRGARVARRRGLAAVADSCARSRIR